MAVLWRICNQFYSRLIMKPWWATQIKFHQFCQNVLITYWFSWHIMVFSVDWGSFCTLQRKGGLHPEEENKECLLGQSLPAPSCQCMSRAKRLQGCPRPLPQSLPVLSTSPQWSGEPLCFHALWVTPFGIKKKIFKKGCTRRHRPRADPLLTHALWRERGLLIWQQAG